MINENNKHSWCVNAFHGMSANNSGSTKMCCMIASDYNDLDNEKIYFIDKISIQENFNNRHSLRIREDLENGIRNQSCKHCWQEEDAGRTSKRMRDNHKYVRHLDLGGEEFKGLAKFELNLGNTCNIKCRTCGPSISSSWMKEDYDLNHKLVPYTIYAQNMRRFYQSYEEDSPFWNDLEENLSDIRQFDFYGGEPFLSKKMWHILSICVDKGYAKNIEIHFNTNGTTWPEDKIECFQHFKEVNLSFSIDGIEEQFEYMRFLAEWPSVLANMQKARDYKNKYRNMNISWCITLSTLNIFDLPRTLDFYYENFKDFGLYLNLVHGPIHYNISTFPENVKTQIVDRMNASVPKHYQQAWMYLDGILSFMKNGTYDKKIYQKLKEVTITHDRYRNQRYKDVFPQASKILGL